MVVGRVKEVAVLFAAPVIFAGMPQTRQAFSF
jgi:hypothetical protein